MDKELSLNFGAGLLRPGYIESLVSEERLPVLVEITPDQQICLVPSVKIDPGDKMFIIKRGEMIINNALGVYKGRVDFDLVTTKEAEEVRERIEATKIKLTR